MGKILGVNLSKKKKEPKRNIRRGYFKKGFGLVGDAHGGTAREVSLLAIEDACPVRSKTPGASASNKYWRTSNGVKKKLPFSFRPGNFAENITTQGMDLTSLPIGTKLKVGEAILEINEIGKGKGLHTYSYKGYSLLPKYGVFCKVIKSAWVKVGDNIRIQK
jgi:MOSC domain-containing protein YiiM